MPETVADGRAATRGAGPLIVVAVLAALSLAVAFLGASPAPVSARELMGATRDPGQPAFVASHRGDADSAPENTLPAVLTAIAAGFDYVEVDVALTLDGAAVLMHDATLDRTTNGSGRLAELPLAYVRSLDAGGWFGAAFRGTPVPLLEEFLDVIAASEARALIELKGEWTAVAVAHLVAALEARGLERRVAATSFDARSLALVATESEVVSRLAILRTLPEDVVQAARALGVRGVMVKGSAVIGRPEMVDELHTAGIRVVVYTFNEDREWSDAIDLGVDGIVTDRPGMLSTWLAAS